MLSNIRNLVRLATDAAGWRQLAELREQQLLLSELESARHLQHVLEAVLLLLDDPVRADEARPYMIAGLNDMKDHVARLEEYVE